MIRCSALLLILLSGCVGNDGLGSLASSDVNLSRLTRVSVGMKQWEVLQVMKQPYSHETFQFDDTTYDVWFYVTNPTALGQTRMVPQNLTPLTFKNGELIGWGFAYYNYLLKKEETFRADAAATQKKEDQKNEDQGLEKALELDGKKPTPSKGTVPKAPVQQAPSKPAAEPDAAPKKSAPAPTKTPAAPGKSQPYKVNPLPPPTSAPPSSAPTSKPGSKISFNTELKLSMSCSPKKGPPEREKDPKPPEKKPPVDEKDEDMIEEAEDQNFNQT